MKKNRLLAAGAASARLGGARSSRILLLLVGLGVIFAAPIAEGQTPPTTSAAPVTDPPAIDPNTFPLKDVPVLIENLTTKRYAFSDGQPTKGKRGAEGGWLANSGFVSPNVVGTDANYYNRAFWILRKSGAGYLIENVETKRYLFSDGEPIKGKRGAEGGWLANSGFVSPKMVGADANYYNRALWTITKQQ
jgi:hypothetical protein